MKRKMLKYTLAALLTATAAGAATHTAYAAVNTYNLPGGAGKMVVITGSRTDCFPGFPEGIFPEGQLPEDIFPDFPLPEFPENGGAEEELPESPDNNQTDNSLIMQVAQLVNEERAKAGLKALSLDERAVAAANVRAKEISSLFSHTRPDGTSFSTALKAAGISFRTSGENIAYGQKDASSVMKGWMNSSGHRANILGSQYTSMGIGHYQDASGIHYWVQLFFQ